MVREKRTIKDSFPPVEGLDREKLRETFVALGKERNAVAARSQVQRASQARTAAPTSTLHFADVPAGRGTAMAKARGKVAVKTKDGGRLMAEN